MIVLKRAILFHWRHVSSESQAWYRLSSLHPNNVGHWDIHSGFTVIIQDRSSFTRHGWDRSLLQCGIQVHTQCPVHSIHITCTQSVYAWPVANTSAIVTRNPSCIHYLFTLHQAPKQFVTSAMNHRMLQNTDGKTDCPKCEASSVSVT